MAPEWKPSSYVFYRIGIPLVVALAGVPLWLLGGTVSAALAAAAALLCYFGAGRLADEIAKAHAQKCLLDEQLVQSQKLASIGELSSGIAHEINNPLAIMSQEIEWARHLFDNKGGDPASTDEIRDSLREIGSQIERCREITHKLLDFARKKEPLIQPVNVNRLVEDMARLVEKEAVQNDIAILRDYGKDLPQVRTDPPLLRQVVLNLLNNASHAIGRKGEITIASRLSENGALDLMVSDTGCGIPSENLARIFDPFFTTKPPGKGTGLGLSICHGIMVRLGGSISVESEEGKGTTFTVHLPYEREES